MQTDTSYSPEQTIVSPPRFPNLIRSNKKTFSNRRRRKNNSPRTVVDSTLEQQSIVDSTPKILRSCTYTNISRDPIATN